MQMNQLITSAAVVVAAVAVGGELPAQQPPAPKSAMAQAEATVARLRDLIRPQPGEYAANIARIAWERDPWEAAVKAGREGKPVIAYGVHSAGVTCGYG